MPDPKFGDIAVSQFINCVMKQGKKHTARRIVYDAFEMIEQKTSKPGLEVFKKALSNARPVLEVKARRVGGATYSLAHQLRQ